jgi:hypothetical protein
MSIDSLTMTATVERLPPALRDQSAGDTIIRDVRVETRGDSSDRLSLFVVLVLTNPPAGLDHWPVDDLWELRRRVRAAIADKLPDLDIPWYVVFEPEHPDLDGES